MERAHRALLAGVLALAPAVAAAQLDMGRLAELVRSGQAQAAYELARAERAAHEGEPRFDFLYGMAAIDSGHVGEGVFALERVLMQRPGNDRARLELARGFFLLEEDLRARDEFETVLAHDPPPTVRSTIERYLGAIRRRADRYRTMVTGYVGLGAGYDTNVNSAPDVDTVQSPFGSIPLSSGGQEQGDAFGRLTAGATISHPLRPGVNLVAGADLDARFHRDETDFETSEAGGRVGVAFRDQDARTRITLDADRLYVGGDAYEDVVGVSARHRRRVGESLLGSAGLRVSQQRYEDQDILDSSTWIVDAGVSHTWRTPWRPTFSGALFGGHETADDQSQAARAVAERDLAGVSGMLRLRVAPAWTVHTSLQFRRSEYDARHLIFGRKREEDYSQVALRADWQPTAHWSVGPRLRYVHNEANIDLYEYDRTVFEVRGHYAFF